jgi:hypothetical protein
VIGGATRGSGIHAGEAELSQIKFIDEHVDDAHRISLADKILQALGQQDTLRSTAPFDESLHRLPSIHAYRIDIRGARAFTSFLHSLGRGQPSDFVPIELNWE